MKVDSTAAAYGLLQVIFADVADRLAAAVFGFRRRKDPNASPDEVYRQEFKRLLEELRQELKQFDGKQSVAEDLRVTREACQQLGSLARWRNDRIHARVRQENDGLALYESKTGKRLSISYEECLAKIQELIRAKVTLECYVPTLLNDLNVDQAWVEFFKTLEFQQEDEGQ